MIKIIVNTIKVIALIAVTLLLVVQLFQRLIPTSNGFFGFRTFIIVSASMEPKLKIGDVILVKNTNPEDIKINDIVSYKGESENFKNKIITHQVKNIKIENDRYIYYTKGSSNNSIDPAVYEEQLYGVMVYKFFILSLISKMIRNVIGFTLLIIVPLLLLFITEVVSIRKEIDERR